LRTHYQEPFFGAGMEDTEISQQDPAVTLDAIYAPVQNSMDEVEQRLEVSLSSDTPAVAEMVAHIQKGMGKRVRSALVLLCARACQQERPQEDASWEKALTLAEAVEMIHHATLIHDDIVDNSPLRRGHKTLNFSYGNELSVLMGDFLFARVFHRLALKVDGPIIQRIAEATHQLCEGEIQEVRSRYLVTLSEAQYDQIIERKTASLMAVSCEVAGMAMKADASVLRALAAYGKKVGMAFQIADDILDLEGSEASLGKPKGHDLLEGKITLPAIYALARASRSERASIQEILLEDPIQPAQLERVVQFIKAQGGLDLARARATRLVAEARGALAALPLSVSRKALEDLAGFFIERKR
jgi:geranylgeranyl pyrophosphate synthase